MHYDKPVRELLADCVRDLRSPFTRQDVLAWFGERYPLVKATTISTHLAGLTEGAQAAHAHLAQYPPLVRRIDHGLYEATAHALGRGARPVARGGETSQPAYRSAPPSQARSVVRSHVLLLAASRRSGPRRPPAAICTSAPCSPVAAATPRRAAVPGTSSVPATDSSPRTR